MRKITLTMETEYPSGYKSNVNIEHVFHEDCSWTEIVEVLGNEDDCIRALLQAGGYHISDEDWKLD